MQVLESCYSTKSRNVVSCTWVPEPDGWSPKNLQDMPKIAGSSKLLVLAAKTHNVMHVYSRYLLATCGEYYEVIEATRPIWPRRAWVNT